MSRTPRLIATAGLLGVTSPTLLEIATAGLLGGMSALGDNGGGSRQEMVLDWWNTRSTFNDDKLSLMNICMQAIGGGLIR
jgi:hypothetical protein